MNRNRHRGLNFESSHSRSISWKFYEKSEPLFWALVVLCGTIASLSLGIGIVFATVTPPTISNPTVFSLESAAPKVDGPTGALTQHIPLDIPPGRNGMQPDISLDYNSQNTDQDSEVGYGWSLSIPYIVRLNKTGTENLYGANAYFTSSMDGELANVPTITSTSSTTTLSNNLVAYWKLDGNSNAATSSFNGTDTSITYNTSNGKINQGAGFNGSSSDIVLGTGSLSIAPSSGDYTAAAWIKLSSTGSGMAIVGRPDQFTFEVNASGKLYGKVEDAGRTHAYEVTGSTTLSTATWYYVAFVVKGGTSLTLYLDGTQDGQNTSSIPSSYYNQTAQNVAIGALDNSPYVDFFNGAIDEAGVWSRTLSSSELLQLYNSGAALAYPFSATSTVSTASSSYEARVDDGSARSYSYATSTNSWTMYDKNGTEYLFGVSDQSQQSATTSTSIVYKWMLEKQIDTNGNYVRYTYNKDGNQIYPHQILYTGHGVSDGPAAITFATSTRPDTTTSYKSDFRIDTNYRISSITASFNGNTVRQYDLSYTNGNNGTRSLLSAVQEHGWDDSNAETTLPAMAFTYVSTSTMFYTPGNPEIAGAGWVVGDVQGNGKNDTTVFRKNAVSGSMEGFVYPDGASSETDVTAPDYWASSSNGHDTNPPWERGVRFTDINGDGKADVVEGEAGTSSKLYLNTYATSTGYAWTSTTTWNGTIPNFGDSDGTTGILADVNGDGLPDFEQRIDGDVSGTAYLGNGSAFDTGTTTIFTPAQSLPVPGTPSGTNSQLLDINGDGLADWIYSNSSSTYVLLNNGNGWNSSPDSRWTIATTTLFQTTNGVATVYLDRGIRFFDINGDGLPDLIHSYTLSPPSSSLAGTPNPEVATYSQVFLNTDSGWATSTAYTLPAAITTGVLVSGQWQGELDNNEYANWIGNGQMDQDVLSNVTYSTGGSTDISYGYTDQSGANPQLPYTLLVVTKLVNHDGRGSNEETDYAYSGGLQYLPSNVIDRKFGGFASTTETRSDRTVTTYYDQGDATTTSLGEQSDGYAQINHAFRMDTFTPGGTLVQKMFYRWDAYEHTAGTFIGLGRQLEQDYASDGSHQDKDTDYTYSTSTDDLIETDDYGAVTGNSDGTFATSSATSLRTTDITYAASSSVNMSVPIEKTLFNSANATTTDSKFYYDHLSFGSVGLGNQTQEQDLISTSTLTYASSTKSYNSYGLVATSTDRNGNATTYVYDAFNLYPATTTNALSQSTASTYEYSNGKVEKTVDPNGAITENVYDGIGRAIEIEESDPSTPASLLVKTTISYTDSTSTPSLVHESDSLNSATSTDTYDYYDGLHRLIQERKSTEYSGTSTVSDLTYDSAGNLSSRSLPYFSAGTTNTSATTTSSLYTTYTYDPLGRVLTQANAVGTTTNVYKAWTTTTTDPDGNIKDYILDAFGNLAQVVEHLALSNATTTYAYDAANNLATTTDAAGNIRHFTYDGLGRRLSATDLHASGAGSFGTWTYVYDAQGNETSRTDAKDQVITHTYDALNRMLTEGLTGSGTQITQTYDSCTNGIGRLCSASSSEALDTYAYDVLGRVTNATSTIGGTSYAASYNHDRQGDVTNITNANGSQIAYTYNSAGLISGVSRTSGGVASSVASLQAFSPTDQLGQVLFGSNASTTYSYDAANLYRLDRILTRGTGSSTLQDLNYTFDANGNILSRTDNSDTAQGQTTHYTYDDLNRLTVASASGGALTSYVQTLTYDSLGNITAVANATSTGSTIAFDTGTEVDAGSGTSITQSYTTGTSTNRLMIVEIRSNPSGSSSLVTSVTYNGASLTKLGTIQFNTVSSPTNTSDLWYLINPASGTHNLVINYSSSMGFEFAVATYAGASQSSFPDTWTTGAQDSGTTFSLTRCGSPTCASGAWTVFVVDSQRIVTAGSNTTARAGTNSNDFIGDSNGPITGSYTMSANIASSNTTAGFMASIAPAGSTGTTTTYAYGQTGNANPDAVTSIGNGSATTTYSYDQNGNLISTVVGATTTTYVYDYANRLTALGVNGATTTYAYDAFGNRVVQAGGGATTTYPFKFYSMSAITSGATTTATSTEYVFDGDTLLATIDQLLINGTASGTPITRYSHPDNLGSTNVTSDANGNLAQWLDYAPYGSVIASQNTGTTTAARQYIGQYSDASGLDYLNARYYNPAQGQFLSEDALFLGNPIQQNIRDPQSLNSYSYSEDNPITKADPMGLLAVKLGVGGVFMFLNAEAGVALGTTDDGGFSFGPYLNFGPVIGVEVSGPQITTANLSEQYSITTGASLSGGTGAYGLEVSKGKTYYPYSTKPPQTSEEATYGLRGGLGAGDITEFYAPLLTWGSSSQVSKAPSGTPFSTSNAGNSRDSIKTNALASSPTGGTRTGGGNSLSQALTKLEGLLQQVSSALSQPSNSHLQ